ncbi:TonB-dependent receptor [Phenylobacterium sp. 58.2.17]|uniref:TonB-dependent receptor n=1 Tax=Phenylobacterium sp. 58.2.17 TaxID=2969306 RepID=UPI002264AD21|nr:TonB-dependent receptor [Phenylobacterium sp. 58.2.17]MCX7587858.1 TonB-dependent receptor [Phenylobacterium sp. 58.2.17]
MTTHLGGVRRTFKAGSRWRALLVAGASATALSAIASQALAQSSDADSGSLVEEIVVTAEKRDASLQDVPVAISAYTSEKRDVMGVNTVEDLARMTPSLSYTSNDRMSVRGIGRLTNAIGTDPSVALYSDGIFSNSMADASTPSLFIERTEVLRGPQGTLYGRNSIGGAMNIIAKRPTEDFNGEVRAMVGNYESYRFDAMVRGPVADNLRFLVGASMERRERGFLNNAGSAEGGATANRYTLEAQIEADLGDNTTARLRYTKFDWDDGYGIGNTFTNNLSPYDTTSFTGAGTSALYYNTNYGLTQTNPGLKDPYTQNVNSRNYGSLDNHHRLHLDVTTDLGWATLKYLGGYQQYDYNTSTDSDGASRTAAQDILVDLDGPGPMAAFTARGVSTDARTFYEERQSWLSNEINLASNGEGPLNWIVGVYQYSQTYDQPQGIQVMGDAAMFQPLSLQGTPAARNDRGAFLYVDGHLETKSYAAFGQIDWEFAENWTLTAGLRYTYDEKDGYDIARYVARIPTLALAFGAAVPPAVAQGFAVDVTTQQVCGGTTLASCAANPLTADLKANATGGLRRELSGDWDAFTGTLGLQWEPDSDTNLYLRYSRGYKAGGWLGSNGLSPDPYADPEYVNSFELGAKKNIGRSLQVNSALFYTDYKGFQAPLTVPLGTITATQFLNLDAAIWGLELETQWAPIRELQFIANYAYLNTEIKEGCCFVDTVDPLATASGARPVGPATNGRVLQSLVGNDLPLSPHHKLTLGATYTMDFTPGSLIFNGTATYVDDQQSGLFNNPIYTAPSFTTGDVRVLWRDADRRYTVIGFVKNVTDEVGFGSSLPSPTAPTAVGARRQVSLIYPRTYGLELQYRF